MRMTAIKNMNSFFYRSYFIFTSQHCQMKASKLALVWSPLITSCLIRPLTDRNSWKGGKTDEGRRERV